MQAAGANPLTHFAETGWHEDRAPSLTFDLAQYLAANPDVAAAHVDPLAHFLQPAATRAVSRSPGRTDRRNGFDYIYYLEHNPVQHIPRNPDGMGVSWM